MSWPPGSPGRASDQAWDRAPCGREGGGDGGAVCRTRDSLTATHNPGLANDDIQARGGARRAQGIWGVTAQQRPERRLSGLWPETSGWPALKPRPPGPAVPPSEPDRVVRDGVTDRLHGHGVPVAGGAGVDGSPRPPTIEQRPPAATTVQLPPPRCRGAMQRSSFRGSRGLWEQPTRATDSEAAWNHASVHTRRGRARASESAATTPAADTGATPCAWPWARCRRVRRMRRMSRRQPDIASRRARLGNGLGPVSCAWPWARGQRLGPAAELASRDSRQPQPSL